MTTCIKKLFFFPALIAGLGMISASRMTAQTFTTLHSFTGGSDGSGPMPVLILSSNILYGTALNGGSSGNGIVFAINTNGEGFTTLHSFPATSGFFGTNSDGAKPTQGLILSGNTLYGTAYDGGSSGNGTIFAVDTDGKDFTNLYNFTATFYINSDGAHPNGLVLSNNTLYGTATVGGS